MIMSVGDLKNDCFETLENNGSRKGTYGGGDRLILFLFRYSLWEIKMFLKNVQWLYATGFHFYKNYLKSYFAITWKMFYYFRLKHLLDSSFLKSHNTGKCTEIFFGNLDKIAFEV